MLVPIVLVVAFAAAPAAGHVDETASKDPAGALPPLPPMTSQAPVEEPGIVERFFPMSLDENLHPDADEHAWAFFVGGLAPFGALVLPLLVMDERPKELVTEGLLGYLVHWLPVIATLPVAAVLGVVGIYAGMFGVLGSGAALFALLLSQQDPQAAGACLVIPVALLCAAGLIGLVELTYLVAVATNVYWCLPVSLVNAYSRARFNDERGSGSALLLPPAPPVVAAAPTMAY